jgi:AcrR family transcriptional regulator
MQSTRPYRHGNLPAALRGAARQILDENGLQAVGLRETARRVGVSATAAYRHFTSKDDLLASVAAEGFRELAAAMEGATRGPNLLTRAGLAYIEFAHQNPPEKSVDIRSDRSLEVQDCRLWAAAPAETFPCSLVQHGSAAVPVPSAIGDLTSALAP